MKNGDHALRACTMLLGVALVTCDDPGSPRPGRQEVVFVCRACLSAFQVCRVCSPGCQRAGRQDTVVFHYITCLLPHVRAP